MRSPATARDTILDALDRWAPIRRLTLRVLCFTARRKGADDELLDEAIDDSSTRSLRRSAQLVVWATRIEATGSNVPAHFDPATHIRSERARSAARAAIGRRLAADGTTDAQLLGAQLIRLHDNRPLDELGREVEAHINELLRSRATTSPTSKPGLEPDLQLRIVTDITDRLAEIGVRPFLMSGTLLGIIRDGGFMAHDYDIDLGLLPTDDLDAVESCLVATDEYSVDVEGDRIVAVHSSGARTDLFPHTARDGKFWHGTLVHEWWNTPFDLKQADVSGHSLWMPADAELYLDENYGDWHAPVAFYDISFDTPNRVYRQTADALLHLHSRCILALRTKDRWLLESSVRELRDHFGVDASEYLADSNLLRSFPVSD